MESPDVEKVGTVSREISSLIAQGVSIEAYAPDYYYTKLDDVKMGLIEKASADARMRAQKIAENAGTKIGRVASARMGVFQITGANTKRGVLGRRLVQHRQPQQEGPHHHADRIPGTMNSLRRAGQPGVPCDVTQPWSARRTPAWKHQRKRTKTT